MKNNKILTYLKYGIKTLASLMLFIGTTSASVTVYEDIKDLAELRSQLKKDNPQNDKTLVIFDIDDTLLESSNFVGSGKWYNWQRGRKVFDKNGKQIEISSEQKFHCMFRTLGTLFEVGSTHLTQKNAVKIFDSVKEYQLMILTARTAKFRAATERELAIKRIDASANHFSSALPGYRFNFNDGNRTAKVTYYNGIVMASGLNKGMVLKEILKQAQQNFEHIYFIDDSWKNVLNMKEQWQDSLTKVSIFHYTKVDKSVSIPEIKSSDSAKIYYDRFLKSAFPDRYIEFKQGSCG